MQITAGRPPGSAPPASPLCCLYLRLTITEYALHLAESQTVTVNVTRLGYPA